MSKTNTTDEFGRTIVDGDNSQAITSHGQNGRARWKQDRMAAPPTVSTASVELGGKKFDDSKSLWNYTKALRDSLDRDSVVEGKPLAILLALLHRHPRATAKIGSGVDTISYGEHKEYKGTQCFMINRTDGSVEDFSFRKCIQAIFPTNNASNSSKSNNNRDKGQKRTREGDQSSSSSSSPKKKRSSTLDTTLTGVLIQVSNLPVGTRWMDLKTHVEVWGKVKFIQFLQRGSTSTTIQFMTKEDVQIVMEKFTEMDGKEVELKLLNEAEEKSYYGEHGDKKASSSVIVAGTEGAAVVAVAE